MALSNYLSLFKGSLWLSNHLNMDLNTIFLSRRLRTTHKSYYLPIRNLSYFSSAAPFPPAFVSNFLIICSGWIPVSTVTEFHCGLGCTVQHTNKKTLHIPPHCPKPVWKTKKHLEKKASARVGGWVIVTMYGLLNLALCFALLCYYFFLPFGV